MLAARDLAFGHPGRTIGTGLTLTLQPGRVLAVLGPNGSGKTTLLKTLLGLLPPHGGRLELDGQPLARCSVRQRARALAYVPQVHATAFAFTVEDVVLAGRTAHAGLLARPSAQDRLVAQAALQRLGIDALAQRPINAVSGGERQLALLARALAQQARAIVLDEPTASLDFGNQGRLLHEIRSLAGDGLAVLLTTHDPNHARRCADDALLMRDGRALGQGLARQVLRQDLLQALYDAPVQVLHAVDGRSAFLPG